jgi:hypothetical protein
MNPIYFKSLFVSVFLTVSLWMNAQTPAFPGAEGGGMYVTGGRGGKVIEVTSLEDTNTQGTLRWAVNQSGARTIVFKVSGIITLKSKLSIKNGNLTIAGQTAPGDGICIRDYEVVVDADNIIIRYLRFRLGDRITTQEPDAFWGRYRKNIIIDHCSMSWSIDECSSFYSNENFTMQWCLIAESLNESIHDKGAHGYGGIWGGKNATFHHNLLAHHKSRNPRFNGWKRSGLSYYTSCDEESVDYRNNVIYNWGDNSAYGGEGAGKYNMVGNYYKYGPGTKSSIKSRVLQVSRDTAPISGVTPYGTFYIADNYVYGYPAVTDDNWSGVSYDSGVGKNDCKADVAFAANPVSMHTAEKAFEKVSAYSGASLVRDAVDERIAGEVNTGTATYSGSKTGRAGIIDTQGDVGGWPEYNSLPALIDDNGDGIPDDWFAANVPPGKTAVDTNEEGYTYLEMYLNALVRNITVAQNEGTQNTGIGTVKKNEQAAAYAVDRRLQVNVNFKKLDVYSVDGMLIYSRTGGRSGFATDLKKGVYLIHIITSDDKMITDKLVSF